MLMEYQLKTSHQELISITHLARQSVQASGVADGICMVFSPHTTAGITINENADPDVVHDLLLALDHAFPTRPEFLHCEGNSAAHMKASTMGSSACIPIQNGQLILGRWQGIYFCEFDGPRTRTVYIQIIKNDSLR